MRYDLNFYKLPQQTILDIRGSGGELDALFESLGVPPQTQHALQVREPEGQIVRIGPRRGLLVADLDCESRWVTQLSQFTAGRTISATAVSDMFQGIRLSGIGCENVLSQVSTLNFLKLADGGACATDIFETAGYLFRVEANTYIIYVESSYLDYVETRLSICAGNKENYLYTTG